MPGPRKPPDPLEERISALPDEPKRAVPPTYPGRLGFGKVLVPEKKPAPPALPRPDRYTPAKPPAGEPWRPKSVPVHEETKHGVAPPAPGSAPQPKRSFSPPPAASEAEERAIEREAQSEGASVRRPPESRAAKPADELSPEVIATAKLLRTGGVALGKWLAGAVVTVVLGGGGALVGSQAANPVPPAVLQCPAELEQLRADMKSLRDRVGATERDIDEATIDRRAQARKHESLQSEVYELGKRVPKVNP